MHDLNAATEENTGLRREKETLLQQLSQAVAQQTPIFDKDDTEAIQRPLNGGTVGP
jgi:hypothetical protein